MTRDELNDILGVEEELPTGAGEGYETGSGNGTAKEPSESDNSANNLANK